MDALDQDITAAFQVISLLLVFALAYFSAIYPAIKHTLDEPVGKTLRLTRLQDLKSECRKYQQYLKIFAGVMAVPFLLLMPLGVRIIGAWARGGQYSMVRAGLICVEFFLIFALAIAVGLYRDFLAKIKSIDKSIRDQNTPQAAK